MKQAGISTKIGRWLLRIIQGALVGGGAILPGISGGVLSVTFGIYEPMMALLAHPRETLRRSYRFFIPVFIGWIGGFLGLARLVEWLFQASSVLAMALFIGLIAGTLPPLFREAGKHGASKRDWTAFTITLLLFYAVLSLFQGRAVVAVDPSIWWFVFCGVAWGLSMVVPGLSSSSILIYLGLYQAMTTGIASLDLNVILPWLVGLVATVALTARLVNYFLKRYHALAYHLILGFVIASTLLIVPTAYIGWSDVLTAIGGFIAGYGVAWSMSCYGEKVKQNGIDG